MNIQFNHDGKNILEFLNLVNDENNEATVKENLANKLALISKRYVANHEGDSTKALMDMQEALSDEEILFLALGVIKDRTMRAIGMSERMSGDPESLLALLKDLKNELLKNKKDLENDKDPE